MNKDDISLWQECLSQHPSAQRKLYERYARTLMGVCVRYTKSREDAEDIFQESFIKIFKNLSSWQGGSLEGWMRRICVNTSITHYHKSKKTQHHQDVLEMVDLQGEDVSALDLLSAQEIQQLVNKLPEGYKMVFNLYVVEGYTHQEIADMLGISEGTSKSQLFKARNTLSRWVTKLKQSSYAQ